METSEIKIMVGTGNVKIIGKNKKYRGFPGAVDIFKSECDRLGIQYNASYGWDWYTATVTLEQWTKIRNKMKRGLERVKNTYIDNGRTCKKCRQTENRGAIFTTAPASGLCDDCC